MMRLRLIIQIYVLHEVDFQTRLINWLIDFIDV
jgi:hypothetical protein